MNVVNSAYVAGYQKQYSLYVISNRAMPSIQDGLISASRRLLWTARDGKWWKTASLGGATMPIHPHASADGTAQNMAAPHVNNVPVFDGDGAFGTKLYPTNYGASRYTAVRVSKFTHDVILVDLDLLPMRKNYDGTLDEPCYFLPLVPMALVNPSEGIAVGLSVNILPRALGDIIDAQLAYLKGLEIPFVAPTHSPSAQKSKQITDKHGVVRYKFTGTVERKNASTCVVCEIPYGKTYTNVIKHLNKLLAEKTIIGMVDSSRDIVKIEIKFARGELNKLTDEKLYNLLGLISTPPENNMNVLGVDGDVVPYTCTTLIRDFTDWRLGWYIKRYEKMVLDESKKIKRYDDILLAIDAKINAVIPDLESKEELEDYLDMLGVNDVEYIASMPIYRLTKEEREKIVKRRKEALILLAGYNEYISSPAKRNTKYIEELMRIKEKY